MKYYFYIGSYAAAEETGIYQFELDAGTGILLKTGEIAGIDNPSFLLSHPSGKVLYAVEELNPDGRIAVFSLKNDTPEYLFSLPSEGADPCHLALDEKGEFLFVSNYTSGSLTVFRLDGEGRPAEVTDHRQHTGHGIRSDRQEGPHVHFSMMEDGSLYICDLGLDCVVCCDLDRESGKLIENGRSLKLPAGTGPRHLAVHSAHTGFFYVVGELTGEVFVFQADGDNCRLIQQISSLPKEFRGKNTAAAIKFSEHGRLLLVSNRGCDSITSFLVEKDGRLKMADCISSGGRWPRDFVVLGEFLVVANQYSDHITVVKYDEDTGEMKQTSVFGEVVRPASAVPLQI